MAVYRPEPELFRRQVESLAAQSEPNWTCIIGIDGPDAVALEFAQQLTAADDRFTVHQFEERLGVYRNFERLLTLVPEDAEWIAFSDQDDYWYPQKLEVLVDELLSDPAINGVTGQARIVTDGGDVLDTTHRDPGDLVEVLVNNSMSGALMVFRRRALELALPFPDATRMAFHDHWVAACCAASGRLTSVPNLVQDYVQHGGCRR